MTPEYGSEVNRDAATPVVDTALAVQVGVQAHFLLHAEGCMWTRDVDQTARREPENGAMS
jgi:hypothetical protein